MKEKPGVTDDPRVIRILDFITKLAAGDLNFREIPSGQNDDIDGIIIGLNMLAEELSHRVISLSEAEKRLDEIMGAIIAIASLDYSKKVPVGDKGDTFDAIASGLNALAEELHASTVSKEYLDNIFQSMSDILLVLTPDAEIRIVNQAALDLLGYSELELIHQPLEKIFDQEAYKELGFAESIKEGSIKAEETTYLTKEGLKIPVSFSASQMCNDNGQIEGTVCVARDITERKLLEQERMMRQERLAQLGQLAAGVGHELRNPLGAIKNSVYFLNMELQETNSEIKETLGILEREVTTSERIIGSLLDFARARPPLKREVVVNDIIHEALYRIDIPDNINVNIQVEASMPITMADPYQLGQVFGNIILNAVQAMPAGGQLMIKSYIPESGYLAVSISDTGVGISPVNVQRIFIPLFTSKAKGIGLGMAITKTFVEEHGGTIEVQSETGKGTTFTVRLPVLNKEE